MGYVTENLAPGEQVVHRTYLHWKMFIGPLIAIIAAFILFSIPLFPIRVIVLGLLMIGGYFGIRNAILLQTAEFAVTNRRIIMKWGILKRHSYDLRLAHLETLNVEQNFLGRIFDFGRISVIGSGGTRALTPDIADPLAFRLHAQSQSGQFQSFDSRPPSTRVQFPPMRECPYCAEEILSKAKVCKYCGRDVEPLSASSTPHNETEPASRVKSDFEKVTSPLHRDQEADLEIEIDALRSLFSGKTLDELEKTIEEGLGKYSPLAAGIIEQELKQRGYEIFYHAGKSSIKKRSGSPPEELSCPSCGKRNHTRAKYCIFCGASLRQESSESNKHTGLCAKCKTQNPPSAKFCNECGYPLNLEWKTE